MASVTKIMLIAFLAQVYAQSAVDKLSESQANAWSLSDTDLQATTLANLIAAAVKPPPAALLVPPPAQVRMDLRAKPNVAFVLADGEEAPPPAAPKEPEVKMVSKSVPYKPAPSAYTTMIGSNPEMKKLLDENKKQCFFKGCGGANGNFAARSFQAVQLPAVVLIGLFLGSGITLTMRRIRCGSSSVADEAYTQI